MKKADFFIIFITALLSLLPLLPLFNAGGGGTVTVTADGVTVYTGPVTADKVVTLPGNTVTIQGGDVAMTEADCPDGLCLRGGKATAARPIVCLPNRVVVTITGKEEDGLDGVTY